LVRALVKGEIDLAYLGPLPLVAAVNISPDLVLLAAANEASGLAEYRCFLVSAHDGPTHATEIKGPIAMVNPLSTCGYISVAYLLARHGVDIETLDYRFVGNQDHLALQVILGHYAAGGMRDVMAEKYQDLLLRVLDTTPLLPGFVLVANRNSFSSTEIEKMSLTLLQVKQKDYQSWGVGNYGFSSAEHLDYELIDTLMTPEFKELFMGDFHVK
jgi:phosphonate transport system substrate-binding protein